LLNHNLQQQITSKKYGEIPMKQNYQLILDKTIKQITDENKKPSLLLHACCAPCSSYVLEYLNKHFDITVFFYNPNITEEYEYKKREEEKIY
jgi:hypothetical protein